MTIVDALAQELHRTGFRARNTAQALEQIAALAATHPHVRECGVTADTIERLLEEREASVSTGVGGGVAFPHVRLDALSDFVIFVLTSRHGVDFDALDGKRVHVFVVILAPTSRVNEHLKLLAGLAKTLNRSGLRRELEQIRTPEVLHEALVRELSSDAPATRRERRQSRLLILILFRDELLNDVLEFLLDMNIEGATIMRAEGMGAHISTLPLFASFLGFMREDHNASHTILALIPAEDEDAIVRGIEGLTGDLDTSRGAMLMTVDLALHKGTMNML